MAAACSSTAAAETLPFAELAYRQDATLALPEPIAAWWQDSVAEALAWWSAATGTPVVADQAATLRSLRLIAGGVPAPDGQLTPTIAGWLHETGPGLVPSLLTLPAAWPGFTATARPTGVTVRSAHGILPAEDEPAAGMRVMLHGPGLSEEWSRALPPHARAAQPSEQDLEEFIVQLIKPWEPAAAVAGSASGVMGTIETGLPARWFKPIDAAVLSRLPAETAAWLALALDGRALGSDLQAALAAHGLTTVWPFALIPLLTPQTVAQACDGTWLVAGGPSGLLIRMPRSAALDALLGGVAVLINQKLPTDQNPIDLGGGLLAACSASDWIIGETADGIAAWFRDSPHLPVQVAAQALIAGWADRQRTSACLEELTDILPSAVALPARTWQREKEGEESAWQRMARQLDGPGSHRLTGISDDGRLAIALEGPVLPWVLPGIAIRWFADIAQDEEGKRHMRAVVDALHHAHQAAFPAEATAALPRVEPARLEQWRALLASLRSATAAARKVRTGVAAQQRLSDEILPWKRTDKDAAALACDQRFLVLTRPLDDPAFPRSSDVLLFLDPVPQGYDEAHVSLCAAAQEMAVSGLRLVAHGDAMGAVLADRAVALLGHPSSLYGASFVPSIAQDRDRAWFIAGMLKECERSAYARWLEEPLPSLECPSAWRGERIYTYGPLAASWLDQGARADPHPPADGMMALRPRLGLWQPHSWRAWTAADTAAIMEALLRCEQGGIAAASKEAFASHALSFDTPTAWLSERLILDGKLAQSRHRLIRIAARLRDVSAAGPLPLDQPAAAAAAGPLALPFGDILLPLTYQRLADDAFRLFVADQVSAPAGYAPQHWRALVAAKDAPAGRHLVLASAALEVVVDPRTPPPPKLGTNDF